MTSRKDTSPTRAKTGDAPTRSVPAPSDIGENTASTLIESPLPPGARKEPHEFADGGGGGGAEAFRRDQAGRATGKTGKRRE